ncbi:MAG: hypothetical protein U1F33_03430 [Alphaproteobacteria bacterium]
MSGLARTALGAIAIALVLTAAFSFAYPHVAITTELIALFALVGLLVAAGFAAVVRRKGTKP